MPSTATDLRTQLPVGTWRLDPTHSSASFAVKHMVVATFRGRFENLDATLTVADDGAAELIGTVDAGSIADPHETLGGAVKIGVTLETVIDRTEFGLEWNAPLPKGGVAVANDVKLTVEL